MTHEGRSKTTARQENQTFKVDVKILKELNSGKHFLIPLNLWLQAGELFLMIGKRCFFKEQKELCLDLVRCARLFSKNCYEGWEWLSHYSLSIINPKISQSSFSFLTLVPLKHLQLHPRSSVPLCSQGHKSSLHHLYQFSSKLKVKKSWLQT